MGRPCGCSSANHRTGRACRRTGRGWLEQLIDPVRGNPDIWVENLEDGSLVRVTTATGSDLFPVWSPDGLRLAYGSGTSKERRLSIAAADGTGVMQELPCPDAYCELTDWSPDGRSLIVNICPATIGAWTRVERVARGWRVGQADSFRAVPQGRRAGIAERTMARLRFGGSWPTGRLRPRAVGPTEASRGVQRRRQPTRLAP